MNTALLITLGVVLWLACGCVAAGFIFAYFTREFSVLNTPAKLKERKINSCTNICLGCTALLLILITDEMRQHGWLWPWSSRAEKEYGLPPPPPRSKDRPVLIAAALAGWALGVILLLEELGVF